MSYEKTNFIIIYKTKWSRWRPNMVEDSDNASPGDSDSDDNSIEPTKSGGKRKPTGSGDDGSDGNDMLPNDNSGGGKGARPTKPHDNGVKPDFNDVNEEPIRNEEGDIPDEPDSRDQDAGALIPIDPNKGKFAKVSDEKVCYLVIKDNTANWVEKCVPVSEDKNKFPPNIIAFVKPKDKNNYFFDKSGKYCKRPDRSNEEVINFSTSESY
jgi:hypothetical protein